MTGVAIGAAPSARTAASTGPPDVELIRVCKDFEAHRAVDDVSLSVRPGSFFSLLGPSGCGKTTTLRLVAGFEDPSEGEVRIQGERVSGLPPYRRNVNTVFQSYALFPHLDVFENVAFGLRRRGTPRAEIQEKVTQALARVHLEGFEKRRPRQMSGGEQQRVAIARALVNTPAVLLLDEPLSALDEKLRKQMQAELKSLQRDLGITFILVTHDQEEALTLSDCLAVMNGGRIEQVGTPDEVYEQPRTRFVAEFIGATNFMKGSVVETSGDLLRVELSRDQAVLVPRDGTDSGAPVDFFVRPEKMWLQTGSPRPSNGRGPLNTLRGCLVDRIYQGALTNFRVRVSDDLVVVVSSQNGHAAEDQAAALGETVYVQWYPGNTRVIAREKAH